LIAITCLQLCNFLIATRTNSEEVEYAIPDSDAAELIKKRKKTRVTAPVEDDILEEI